MTQLLTTRGDKKTPTLGSAEQLSARRADQCWIALANCGHAAGSQSAGSKAAAEKLPCRLTSLVAVVRRSVISCCCTGEQQSVRETRVILPPRMAPHRRNFGRRSSFKQPDRCAYNYSGEGTARMEPMAATPGTPSGCLLLVLRDVPVSAWIFAN